MSQKAVVLLNMGGPNNLDEVELFLKNMFNDKNIITVKSDLLRKLIAFMITTSRKKEARSNYEKLGGKSPLVDLTKELVVKLQSAISDEYRIFFAMRYTPPFAQEVIEKIEKEGIEEVILLPLYPQYSTTTTKSSLEDFYEQAKQSSLKKISYLHHFYSHNLYNEAVVEKIIEKLEGKNPQEYEMIFSAHSLPQKIVDSGDPYQKEVIANVEILKQMLTQKQIHFRNISIAYQSKLGPLKWLDPALSDVLETKKDKKVIIFPIAFIVDNSETRFELSVEYQEVAHEVGISDYLVCDCVNSSDTFVQALCDLIYNGEFIQKSL